MEIFLTEYNKFGVVNGFIGEPEWGRRLSYGNELV